MPVVDGDAAPLGCGDGVEHDDVSSFDYSRPRITPSSSDGDHELEIRFRLSNSGHRKGTEVAQAYVELPSSTGEPAKRLVAWRRVTLDPGEHRDVEITLSRRDLDDMHLLEHWDTAAGRWKTARGTIASTWAAPRTPT